MVGCIVMTVNSGNRITKINTIMPTFINKPSPSNSSFPQKKIFKPLKSF